jgi:predicted RNA-binding Zn-ribbon protein involved in translation (DUF1610 family)
VIKMGWKGHEIKIPAGMVFRKMYCHMCEIRLGKYKVTNEYKKGEKGYRYTMGAGIAIGMDRVAVSTFIYKCPNCGHEITYDDQCVIAKIQKKLKKKVLTQDEISDYWATH